MINTIRLLSLLLIFVVMPTLIAAGPSSEIIIQAASPETKPANATVSTKGASQEPSSLQTALKLIQEMKAGNEETLKKQEAVLAQLDELQKTADQIKAFSKRD